MASFLTQLARTRFHSEQQFDAATLVGYHAARSTPAWQLVEKSAASSVRRLSGLPNSNNRSSVGRESLEDFNQRAHFPRWRLY